MKRLIATALCAVMVAGTLTGCGNSATGGGAASDDPSVTTINVWAFTDEVPKMIEKYKETHPDFKYEINPTIIATTDGAYQPALDQALAAGGPDAPDIYCAE